MAESRASYAVNLAQGLVNFFESGGNVIQLRQDALTLKEEVFALKQELLAVTEENRDLKARQAELDAFAIDRSQYADHRLPSGAWVVIARRIGEQEFGEQGMYLCRRCFTQHRYEVLQPVNSGRALECHECRSVIDVGSPVSNIVDINRWD